MKEQTEVLSQDVRVSVFNILKKTERKSLNYHTLNLRQFLKPLDVSAKTDKMKLKIKYKKLYNILTPCFPDLNGENMPTIYVL